MTPAFRVAGLAALAVLVGTTACKKEDVEYGTERTVTSVRVDSPADKGATSEPAAPITLTEADLNGFEKGIARETELVKEASQKSASAKTPQERGEAIQAGFETNTIAAAAPVTGLSVERYKVVRETLSNIMTTLDFQGVIDGPQSVDTARADAAMKARLSSDPYKALDAGSAALLKSRMSRLVPVWLGYINLTALNG